MEKHQLLKDFNEETFESLNDNRDFREMIDNILLDRNCKLIGWYVTDTGFGIVCKHTETKSLYKSEFVWNGESYHCVKETVLHKF